MRLKFNINYSDGTTKEHNITRTNPFGTQTKNQLIAREWLSLCVNYVHLYLENDVVVKSIEYIGGEE